MQDKKNRRPLRTTGSIRNGLTYCLAGAAAAAFFLAGALRRGRLGAVSVTGCVPAWLNCAPAGTSTLSTLASPAEPVITEIRLGSMPFSFVRYSLVLVA